MAQIEFNEAEAGATIQLIDIAVKASGLQAAEAGLAITKKIRAAFLQEEVKEEPKKK